MKFTGVPGGRIGWNYVLLASGEAVSKLLAFFAYTRLARALGPAAYGDLEFVVAVMVFFTLPVDFGLGAYGAREIASGRGAASVLLGEITRLRLALAACSFLVLSLFALTLSKSAEVKLLLLLYGTSLFGAPLLLQWIFQAYERMDWVSVVSMVRQGVFAASVLILFAQPRRILMAGVAEAASVAVAAGVCVWLARTRMRLPLGSGAAGWSRFRQHFREGMPIGLTELAWAFSWYSVTVLLGFLASNGEVGWFGASHRLLMSLHTFVWLYFFNLLPVISRSASGRESLDGIMNGSVPFTAWASTLAALAVTAFARPLVAAIYGARFEPAAVSLAALAWVLPLAMLSGHYRYTLIAYGRQALLFYCMAASAAAAVAVSLVLIPMYGGLGGAVGLLAGNAVTLVLCRLAVRRYVSGFPMARHVAGPAAAALASGMVFAALRSRSLWLAAAAGALCYALAFVLHKRRGTLELRAVAMSRV